MRNWKRLFFLVVVGAYGGSPRCWGDSASHSMPFRVEFDGNNAVPAGVLQKVILRPEYEQYTVYLVDDLAEAVEDAYHVRGFADVEVNGSDEPEGDGRLIRISIEEGVRYRVFGVLISGNKAFPMKRLATFLNQHPRWKKPAFYRSAVERDRRSLRDFYLSHGFLRVKISGDETLDPETGTALIRHQIDEGERYRLGGLAFAGNEVYSATELEKISDLNLGDIWNPTQAGAARARILDHYQDKGYAYAKVDVNVIVDDNNHEVRLAFTIVEGTQVRIARVHLKGNTRTNPKIIWREADLAEGQPYSRRALFENRKRIFSTGLFSSVEVEPSSPLTGEATTDVSIQVEEAKPFRLGVGVGYGTEEGARFSLETAYRNLLGLGQEIGFVGSITQIGDQEEIYHRYPRVFGSRFDLRSRALHEYREEPSFSVERWGGGADLERRFGSDWLLRLGYSFEDIYLEDVDISPSVTDFRENEGFLSKGRAFLSWDRRDVALNPHSGFLSSVDVQLGGGPFGGDFEFMKTRLSSAGFVPVTKHSTFVLATRWGWIEPFGKTEESPLSERFLTGGANSIRGFERNEVGPTDENGEFIGGDALFILNAEYRFPIYKELTGALFFDMGNVWPTMSDFDLSETRESAGVGIRYISTVGAIRLDYGRVLDRELGEASGQFHFTVGYAF